MNWSLSDIAQLINLSLPEGTGSAIKHISIDSRTIIEPSSTLFIALKGPRNNGHDYIPLLLKQGVKCFIVSENIETKISKEADFLHVNDTLDAFQKIAAFHRTQFAIPVIGVTGSNGKTIVKEWLSECLRTKQIVAKSPKSFNSQVGVPLSVLQLDRHHEIGIFEAGISKQDEMGRLETIIKPSIGIFTNIGSAHDQGFYSRQEKIEEKAKLFENCNTIIYCSDHEEIATYLQSKFDSSKLCSWGKKGDVKTSAEDETYQLIYKEQKYSFHLPFNDKASSENVLHVICTLLNLDYSQTEITNCLQSLSPVKMRLSLLSGINNSLIIDDSYSNDVAALELSLGFLNKHRQDHKAILVLSDLKETGLDEDILYEQVAQLVNNHAFEVIHLVGQEITWFKHLFKSPVTTHHTSEDLLEKGIFENISDYILLIKGARSFHFEKIVKKLSKQLHETTLEINLDLLTANLNYFKSCIKPSTKVMAMVKAYAYGSGYLEVAQSLAYQHIDYLAVAYIDEGIALRKNGIKTPIMVLNAEPDHYQEMLQYDIEPEIFRVDQLKQYLRIHPKTKAFRIHIKLDTGMHRLGFSSEEFEEILLLLSTNPQIRVKSVFTHLSSADDPNEDTYTRKQLETFHQQAIVLENIVGYTIIKHALNSAGIQRFPKYQMDMVRLGIGLYGLGITKIAHQQLKVIGTLKSTISQIKTIEKGETIGYNRKGKANEKMTIATIAIGYADGYNRRFSNGVGKVFIGNELRPVIGNVCMDMTMIDITGLQVKVHDEVEIFGPNVSWATQAKAIGTIPYELLTSIGERVKRIFFEGDLI